MKFVAQCLYTVVAVVALLAIAPVGSADMLCSGGQVVWSSQGKAVGCVFKSFGQSEKSMCNPYPVQKPSLGGDCWVCVKPGLAAENLKVGVNLNSAVPANGFPCLNREPSPHEPAHELANNSLLQPGIDSPPGTESCSAACGSARWTGWLDRDQPGGSGDYETLADFQKQGKACSQPLAIECETTSGVPMPTGDGYTCDPGRGGVCVNAPGRRCENYRVRFCCG